MRLAVLFASLILITGCQNDAAQTPLAPSPTATLPPPPPTARPPTVTPIPTVTPLPAGARRIATETADALTIHGLSPDGTLLAYSMIERRGGLRATVDPNPPYVAPGIKATPIPQELISTFRVTTLHGRVVASIPLAFHNASWSPDGNTVAGVTSADGDGTSTRSAYLFDVRSHALTPVPIDPGFGQPRTVGWAPDGSSLAIVTGMLPPGEPYLRNVDNWVFVRDLRSGINRLVHFERGHYAAQVLGAIWTADSRSLVLSYGGDADACGTALLDLTTGRMWKPEPWTCAPLPSPYGRQVLVQAVAPDTANLNQMPWAIGLVDTAGLTYRQLWKHTDFMVPLTKTSIYAGLLDWVSEFQVLIYASRYLDGGVRTGNIESYLYLGDIRTREITPITRLDRFDNVRNIVMPRFRIWTAYDPVPRGNSLRQTILFEPITIADQLRRVSGTDNCLNLRREPRGDAPILTCFPESHVVVLTGTMSQTDRLWWQVIGPGQVYGWAAAEFLKPF